MQRNGQGGSGASRTGDSPTAWRGGRKTTRALLRRARACFAMALNALWQKSGQSGEKPRDGDGCGDKVTRVSDRVVESDVVVEGSRDYPALRDVREEADKGCPVSNAIVGR